MYLKKLFTHCIAMMLLSLVALLLLFHITFALIQQPASPLFGCLTLTSADISLPFRFESLLCFKTFFFRPKASLTIFRASRRSCSLCWNCSFFSQASLVCLYPRRFWRRRCCLHSCYSNVFSFTPFKRYVSVLNKL